MSTPQWNSLTRRDFLIAASAGGLALAGCTDAPLTNPALSQAPSPIDLSQVEHVVVCMMENRSFDHFLGWLPHADAKQSGLSYPDRNGVMQKTYPLAPDYQGCGLNDPDHSIEGGRTEYHNGACDGWLVAGQNDRFAIGYYTREDLAFLGPAAGGWTSFDRYFSSILGPTYPNRMYQHCAQTDRLTNSLAFSSLTTIWDRLFAASVSAKYYFTDAPFLILWGDKYFTGPQAISNFIPQFYADCEAGNLPAVSFVEPPFVGSLVGTSADDHPFADIRAGEAFLNRVYRAVTQSPAWPSTVLLITYDEWGGFFDHVPPPTGSTTQAERDLGYTDGRLGFRVPTVLISPFAQRRFVSHDVLEHCSTLKLIEQRWNLTPLTQRDANATSLANALFTIKQANRSAPQYSVPDVSGSACPLISASVRDRAEQSPWVPLWEMAKQRGFAE